MLNCSVILEESAREYADKAAVVCTSTRTRMTHKQLVGKVNQLVNGLRKFGIKKGDKVLVVCPNRIEFPVVFFALLKSGAGHFQQKLCRNPGLYLFSKMA